MGGSACTRNGDEWWLSDFDFIHASPPCQFVTYAASQWRKAGRTYPDLIAPTRQLLQAAGLPYVIENVPRAPLINPIILTGAMFGLRVKRDRLFECSFDIPSSILPAEEKHGPPVKMGRPFNANLGETFYPVGHFSGVQAAREAMEIDWMTGKELSQAIPPAYTRFIGEYWLGLRRQENTDEG